jgi:DNA-binding GntR family transcriptional regulator
VRRGRSYTTYARAVNKQELAYSTLRDRIHAGGYQPLDRLNIDALARELGVSPIPVREALRRLEAEGWVQFKPHVGAIVAPVDATSWEQAMVSLAILEGAASGEARRHIRKVDLAGLRRLCTQMEKAAGAGDPLRFGALNRSFHDAVVARCGNEVLLDLLRHTHRRLDQLRRTMFVYLPDRSTAALGEHRQLMDLLESGTPDEVESYARWHKMQTVEAYRGIRGTGSAADGPVGAGAPVAENG